MILLKFARSSTSLVLINKQTTLYRRGYELPLDPSFRDACMVEDFICLSQIPDCNIPQPKLEMMQTLSERETLNLLLLLTVVSKTDTTSLSLVCFQRLLIVSLLSPSC
jgi:hypothetical protein